MAKILRKTTLWGGGIHGDVSAPTDVTQDVNVQPMAFPALDGGDGSEANPYKIRTDAQLAAFRDAVNSGVYDKENTDYAPENFVLTASIDLGGSAGSYQSGTGWTPIGSLTHRFFGNFDGKGHAISNLYIYDTTSYDGMGLFGIPAVNNSARISISNLTLVGANISSLYGAALLVGNNFTEPTNISIDNCHVDATSSVKSSGWGAAGFVGSLTGVRDSSYGVSTITNSSSAATVESANSAAGFVVILSHDVIISDSYATGSVTGKDNIGGFVSHTGNGAKITRSYATGNVTAIGHHAGGFVAFNSETDISYSYATGNVKGPRYVGGFVGSNKKVSHINNSYATGNVEGGEYVGGFAGFMWNESTLTDVYSRGNVKATGTFVGAGGSGSYAGGLVGSIEHDEGVYSSYGFGMSAVVGSYTLSSVAGEGDYVGGLVGYVQDGLVSDSVALNESVTSVAGANVGRIIGFKAASRTDGAGNFYFSWVEGNNAFARMNLPASHNTNTEAEGVAIDFGDYSEVAFWQKSGSYDDGNVGTNSPYINSGAVVRKTYPFTATSWLTAGGQTIPVLHLTGSATGIVSPGDASPFAQPSGDTFPQDNAMPAYLYPDVAPPAPIVNKIPVYRAAKYQGGYFYTSNLEEYKSAVNFDMRLESGPNGENPAFYATDANTPGAVPIYRSAKLSGDGYFYTADPNEHAVTPQYNMRQETTDFYVMPASSSLYGEIPLYRGAHLTSHGNGNEGYIYTANWDEYASALPDNGYRQESEVFRVFAG